MTPFLLLLSLQLPVAQDPAPVTPARFDIVELKNGDQLEGHITSQLDGYVEVQLEAGATVGITMTQVKEIRRGAGGVAAPALSPVPPRNEWFVLHDAQGASVGWLHAAVVVASGGGIETSEEYEFVEGRRRYQVTSLCRAGADLEPQSCYFRERVSEPVLGVAVLPGTDAQSDRIVDERIVEATCRDSGLLVSRLDRNGKQERTLEWSKGRTFPLLARTLARQRGAAAEAATMFDPATEELVVHSFDGARPRRVTLDGKTQSITEIAETSPTGRNSEWLDASMHTVRREIAGPSLVAVPSSAESARSPSGGPAIPSALVREAGGTFGLWAPNPAWSIVDGLPAGQLALVCAAHDASIGLTSLEHLEPGTPLETAVDSVANWFRLLYPELRIERRESIVVRDRPAVRLVAGGSAAGASAQATVDIITHHDRFLVLVCRAPVAAWDELAPDFAMVQRSIELEPQSMTPTLQGPLAEPKGHAGNASRATQPERRGAKKPAPSALPATATSAKSSGNKPIVRVPKQG